MTEGKIISRIQFVDINQSYNVPVADTVEKGYMVIRAPKGTDEAIYIPKGQTQTIHSMVGLPTVKWPDIQEAIDYNNRFGLYIAAPAGSSEEYPSTYGGNYLTKYGLYPLYNVTDKDNLTYEVLVPFGTEQTGFLKAAFNNLSLIQGGTGNPGTASKVVMVSSDQPMGSSAFTPMIKRLRFTWENPDYTTPVALATYEIYQKANTTELWALIGETEIQVGTIDAVTQENPTGTGAWMLNLNGAAATDPLFIDASSSTARSSAAAAMSWVIDVSDDTYMTIIQKSPTEAVTKTTITNIGYDEKYYDSEITVWSTAPTTDPGNAILKRTDGLFMVKSGSVYTIKKFVGSTLTSLNSSYKNKYFKAVTTTAGENNGTVDTASVDSVFYVNPSTSVISIASKEAPDFNTVTFKVEEEVYPGQWVSGGTFTGSLSETGVDSYGSRNYFGVILPSTLNTFVDVIVNKVFDTTNGWFTGYKEADERVYGRSASVQVNFVGTRYITNLLTAEPAADCSTVLLDGWTEAGKDKYEGVNVFMDPVGYASVQVKMGALRANTQKLSTFISTLSITPAEVEDPSTIYIPVQSTGFALYVNKFYRKDSYSGKKYLSSCIGAMGSNLSKIVQDKLGGWAPMYTNISTGLGGQLDVDVESALYDFSEDQRTAFDMVGLNPIVLDPTYGVMATSQKTTLDPLNLSDWSYLGHSMSFDKFKREAREGVMKAQIGKPNDTYFQSLRKRQIESILGRRISGISPIWTAGKVEVAGVNTDEIKAQRGFAIQVRVKVTPYSEWVTLTLINIGQQMTV